MLIATNPLLADINVICLYVEETRNQYLNNHSYMWPGENCVSHLLHFDFGCLCCSCLSNNVLFGHKPRPTAVSYDTGIDITLTSQMILFSYLYL